MGRQKVQRTFLNKFAIKGSRGMEQVEEFRKFCFVFQMRDNTESIHVDEKKPGQSGRFTVIRKTN